MKDKILITLLLGIQSILGSTYAKSPDIPAPGGQEVRIPSQELLVGGLLYRPTISSEKKLPAVVIVHGWEPSSVRPVIRHSYVAKEYAEAGYVAISIALRGWEPTGGDDDCGLTQANDVVNVAKWLSKQEGVDPNRIGLWGKSLGAQIVLSAAAKDSLIKATAAYFPITDFVLWGKTSELSDEIKDYYIYGVCTKNGSPEDRSPLLTSEKISGAVLLLHGDKDKNVLIEHSKLMYKKMQKAKQDVSMHIVKGGGHSSRKPEWQGHSDITRKFFQEKL